MAVLDYDDERAGPEQRFVAEVRGDLSFRQAAEVKLSHPADLRRRLVMHYWVQQIGDDPRATARV